MALNNKDFKAIFIGIAFLLAIPKLFAKTKSNMFSSLNKDNTLRNCDAYGCGHFGASRGTRKHNGIDFKVHENEAIKAPFDCTILRYGYPYANDVTQQLIEIKGLGIYSEYTAKIMYIKPVHPFGTNIPKGDTLCTAGNIASKHGNAMTNHVHFELYKNGVLINPEPFFK